MSATTAVLGVPVQALSLPAAVERIVGWASSGLAARVCFVNAHAAVTAGRDGAVMAALRGSELNLPDGAPVAWMLRRLGHRHQRRVSGPDCMVAVLAACEAAAVPIYLMGSTPQTLERLRAAVLQRWPRLLLAGLHAPPFRAASEPPSAAEDSDCVDRVRVSGARLLFVGLGCPKQELWMARMAPRLPVVMLGVGAAFDFLAGTVQRAPRWMQRRGLEWLYRLLREPRRLGGRYVDTNLAFLLGAWRQLRQVRQVRQMPPR